MVSKNANQLLLWGLVAALTSQACNAQGTSVPKEETSQGSGHASSTELSTKLPEMAPPKPPKVTCVGDQLTISADNSTLGGVLAAVHTCLGVQIDIPEGAVGNRVFGELGPGPARQVLDSLLSGTDFNFVIGSSDANPQKIETILLMSRSTETANTHDSATDRSVTPARRAWLQSRQNRSASLTADESSQPVRDEILSTPETEETAAAPAVEAGANPVQVPTTDASSQPTEAPSPSGDGSSPKAPSTATLAAPSASSLSSDPGAGTEQKISSMEQLFQQRRQMNQNPTPTPTPTPPQP